MENQEERTLGAIILAAGRGKRMQATDTNKVALFLANKPLILHAIHTLEDMHFDKIVVVIGFAKESVMEALKDSHVLFAEQKELLGTADAVKTALEVVPSETTDVLIIQGDDSAFYKHNVIQQLTERHVTTGAALTLLTIDVKNPYGLGRIVRNEEGNVAKVVEEKDATDDERKINEINPACYLFRVSFLKDYLHQVEKSPVTGEYYLTSLIDLAIKHGEKVETVRGGKMVWRGVNTQEELEEAERLYNNRKG